MAKVEGEIVPAKIADVKRPSPSIFGITKLTNL